MIKKFLIVIFSAVVILAPVQVFGQDNSDLDNRIRELKQKIAELQSQENTLSKEIGKVNIEIQIQTFNIESKRSAITRLAGEADQLNDQINRLEVLLNKRLELWLRRIPEAYKRQTLSQFGMMFFGKDFQDFLLRVKYISSVQTQDTNTLRQLKETQRNFSERKQLREDKKAEQEVLKIQLEQAVKELEKQKRTKQSLLEQTKNSEATYQTMLAQALAEKQAVDRALVEGVKVGPVKKGDPIALFGNTGYPGCSTGAHLHFEVRKNGSWVNAEGYLNSRDVADQQNGGRSTIGSGGWDWPLEGDIVVTQRYGQTPYSWRYAYSGGIHTGLDMISNSSAVIRAPADGTLFSSSQACGSSSIIKIKYIEHADQTVSFYLHVQ